MGNWLTRDQTKELLTVPDRSKIKGKRDYVILGLLLGCALRRQELASLDVDGIQMREGRVLTDTPWPPAIRVWVASARGGESPTLVGGAEGGDQGQAQRGSAQEQRATISHGVVAGMTAALGLGPLGEFQLVSRCS